MTDQIYYKVQYPLKKAINVIKKIDQEADEDYELSPEERKKINEFLNKWESGAKSDLKSLIRKLKKS